MAETSAEGEAKDERPRSVFPRLSAPPPPPRGHDLRVVFAVVWIAVQIVLVGTASHRADGAFGFRMFPEASTIKIALFREVDGQRLHVANGIWAARSSDGAVHRYSWFDRVSSFHFDVETSASYGAAAQLDRLQHALDDVAAHADGDLETRRFVAEVVVRRNGHEPVLQTLSSHERVLP